MSRRISIGGARAIGVALCLFLGLALAPAANASFSSTDQAASSFSAATLTAPTLWPTCARNHNIFNVSIPVPDIATVPYSNYLELTVKDPAGVQQFKGDVNTLPGRTYSASPKFSDGRGTWTYEISAQYKVPNSSNVWTSPLPPAPLTFVCS